MINLTAREKLLINDPITLHSCFDRRIKMIHTSLTKESFMCNEWKNQVVRIENLFNYSLQFCKVDLPDYFVDTLSRFEFCTTSNATDSNSRGSQSIEQLGPQTVDQMPERYVSGWEVQFL